MMNLLKKSLVGVVGAGSIACFMLAGNTVFAANLASKASSSGTLTQAQQQDLSNLKTKGSAEITRRLTSLNSALTTVGATTKLSSSDKSYLESEINTEITGLTSLQTTLNSETTLSSARADVQSIFSEYRVYALVLPKTRLVKAADGEQNTDTQLTTLANSLQTQITTDGNSGKNVTSAQNTLNDMNTQITNAQSIASSIESKVLTLAPSDYNTDHTILSGDLAQLKTAHADNLAAYNDGKTIAADLKNL